MTNVAIQLLGNPEGLATTSRSSGLETPENASELKARSQHHILHDSTFELRTALRRNLRAVGQHPISPTIAGLRTVAWQRNRPVIIDS